MVFFSLSHSRSLSRSLIRIALPPLWFVIWLALAYATVVLRFSAAVVVVIIVYWQFLFSVAIVAVRLPIAAATFSRYGIHLNFFSFVCLQSLNALRWCS